MRKIIGIGETVYDILFKDNQPTRGIPGGSALNTMVSLGRLGLSGTLISEVGRDHIGRLILSFLEENNVNTSHLFQFYDGKSPVSLAFLNERNEADYESYLNYPADRLDIVWPRIDADDLIVFGSYYSLYPALRTTLTELLTFAQERKAIICYDPDFSESHESDVLRIMPSLIENLEFANIVRGSVDDFKVIYKETDVDKIYRNHIRFYCPVFICTDGAGFVYLRTPSVSKQYEVPPCEIVSLVGAGDAFNAGLSYGIDRCGVTLADLNALEEKIWDRIIDYGISFSREVCQQLDNYISRPFAASISGR